ncbi:MAG: hypothetical protein KJO59_11375 [Ignavibacteria bacterium]|nr:hypothetical protein [Ignavibacteria bacterium]
MIRIFYAILLISLFFIVTACGPDYNTNFEPPPPNASVKEVFPEEIDGMKVDVKRMDLSQPLEGFSAKYGVDKISIDAILAPAKSTADDHFADVIVPRFDEMKNHYRGKVNGKWSASGTDNNGRKWFAWVNNSWIFVMSGSDKGNLMKAIDAFNYVAL